MIFFHIRIVHRLQYRIPKQHRRSRTSMRTRRRVTILVLSVITVHLLCCSPYWAFQMFMTSELLPQNSSFLFPASSIGQFLLFVNSSTNPILYAFISEIFRTSFQRVFLCLSADQRQLMQEKTMMHQSMIGAADRINYLQSRTKTTTRILINDQIQSHQIDYQRLSISTKPSDNNLITRQIRLSSLAPTASIFISETSVVSDV